MVPATFRQRWSAYRTRWKRRELLWRCIRAGRRLSPLSDRTGQIAAGDILLFATVRNEIDRLPEFLDHYRGLGVDHFLIVDNHSDDGSADYLRGQPDLSLWRSGDSYRAARFGMDWLGALQFRHGHGHWCVTVDADELLIYPDYPRQSLTDLTARLDREGVPAMGALMLEPFPTGPLGTADAGPDAPMMTRLPWFQPGPFRTRIVQPRRNRITQGGVRERFFRDDPDLSPTLNKLPLVRWHWRHVYVNSTHSMLPPRLNDCYDGPGDPRLSGVLLHGKFLPQIAAKSDEELQRGQHFVDPARHRAYHRELTTGPVLHSTAAQRYEGWEQLVALGLMGTGEGRRVRTDPADLDERG